MVAAATASSTTTAAVVAVAAIGCVAVQQVPPSKMASNTTDQSVGGTTDQTNTNNNNNNNGGGGGAKTTAMAAGVVDQLRQQLQLVVENGDLEAATALIGQLENAVLNKETLEATRVGRFVNDVRKQIAQQWPEFSKRCRALIKQWQKIAEYRPSSCEGSSNGGTPQLVSPALRRGLTPRTTPGGGSKRVTPQQPQPKQRVTSTGLLPPDARQITGSSTSTSPQENGMPVASGSYAPLSKKKKISPQMDAVLGHLHKSASVGAAMCHQAGAVQQKAQLNGVIPEAEGPHGTSSVAQLTVVAEHPAAMPQPQQNPPLTLKLKRSASGVQRLTTVTTGTTTKGDSVSPPAPQQLQSVHAARRNVQSTAELVAQLSEALPQNIGIDLGTTAAAKMETLVAPKVSPDLPTSSTQDVKGAKRRYQTRRGGRRGSEESVEAVKTEFGEKAEKEEAEERMKREEDQEHPQEEKTKKAGRGRKKKKKEEGAEVQAETTTATTTTATTKPAKFNWFSEYSLDDGAASSSSSDQQQQLPLGVVPAAVHAAPLRSFILPARDRQLTLFPYVDIGLPDWKVHQFPHPERFLFPTDRNGPPNKAPQK